MIPEVRREKIIKKLLENDIYTLDNLKEELKVSRITIQRDVNILVERGIADKVHGGVRLRKRMRMESRFSIRINQNINKKLEIAKKALNCLQGTKVIFLDSSSTVYIFAKELFKDKYINNTLITTSPVIINEALELPEVKIISTGGELWTTFNMFAGSWVEEFLRKVNIDTAYISAAGVTEDGEITSNNKELAKTISIIFERSDEVKN